MRVQAFLRSLPAFVVTTLALIVLADRLLAGTSAGWVVGPLLLTGAAVVLLRHPHLLRDRPAIAGMFLLVPIAGACVYDRGVLAPLLGVLVLVAATWWGRGARYHDAWGWLRAVAQAPFRLIAHLRTDRRLVRAWRLLHGTRVPGAGLLAWVLPLGLGVGFSVLFGVANPVIGRWFADLGEWAASWLDVERLLPAPTRIVLWWSVAALAWTLLRVHPPRLLPVRRPIPAAEVDRNGLVLRSLLVVNAVFMVQVGMDVLYLAGGLRLPKGMTYATYAHRGAWPLLIAALVSAALVLAAFRPGGVAERSPWARRLVLLWLAQNIALTVAAAWRLWLYVDAYGLSEWRLAAAIWMGLVAAGLVLIALRIALARGNRWLIDANIGATLATLLLCCWLDVGGTVAWHNVRHCREVGGDGAAIDLGYLRQLGGNAAPALTWLAEHSRDPSVARQAGHLAAEQCALVRDLLTDWRAWTWIRARAAESSGPLRPVRADDVRHRRFEPQTDWGRPDPEKARYTDAYKTTALSLEWLEDTRKQGITLALNAASRRRDDVRAVFERETGKDLDALWREYLGTLR
jgi:hypothetical protein